MQRSEISGVVFKPVVDPPSIDQLVFWPTGNANPCLSGFLALCAAGVLAGGNDGQG